MTDLNAEENKKMMMYTKGMGALTSEWLEITRREILQQRRKRLEVVVVLVLWRVVVLLCPVMVVVLRLVVVVTTMVLLSLALLCMVLFDCVFFGVTLIATTPIAHIFGCLLVWVAHQAFL
jgi:hypothetical protein